MFSILISFCLVFRYLYNDHTYLDFVEQALEFLKVAHTYQVTRAVEFCTRYLTSELLPENACTILDVALLYDLTDLIRAACELIDKDAEASLDSVNFPDISLSCLTYILKGDTLNMDEKLIFHRAIDWSFAECQKKGIEHPTDKELREALGEAFYHLRTPTLCLSDFVECTRTRTFYDLSEYQDIVAAISGSNIKVSSNLNKQRVPYTETVTLAPFAGKEVIYNKVKCSYKVNPRSPFTIKGFEVKRFGILQEKSGATSYWSISTLQKNVECNVSVNGIHKQCFTHLFEPKYFYSPIRVTNEMTITFEIDFSWLFSYGTALAKFSQCTHTCCRGRQCQFSSGIKVFVLAAKALVETHFGNISFETGDGFVEKFFVENFSNREELPMDDNDSVC